MYITEDAIINRGPSAVKVVLYLGLDTVLCNARARVLCISVSVSVSNGDSDDCLYTFDTR